MSFVYPLLLGGLVLVGIPVLLHLIMRQKPKHLLFPAVRFLLQRHRTNQRKLQLRHLLLLALRMLLIALVCLALARPKIFSERFNFFSSDRPVAAVLLFDVTYSMEYTSGNRSRLEEAKRRGQELLDGFPEGSRVAILTTADQAGEWLAAVSQARERIAGLELRPVSTPITNQLLTAYDLLAKLEQEVESTEEAPRRAIYVFSDRSQACWNSHHLENLQRLRDRFQDPKPVGVFFDVGVEHAEDVAIAGLELPKQVIAANEKMLIRATLQATGGPCDTELALRIDGEAFADKKPVKLNADQSVVITFERRNLQPGLHQAEVSLATPDAMPFDNTCFATFEVQGPRQILTLTDNVRDADIWALALKTFGAFECQVKAVSDPTVRNFGPKDLAPYKAVCLMNVASPSPNLWGLLEQYVLKNGGGLAVIPAGNDLDRAAYNSDEAQKLLPARLVKIVDAQSKTKEGAIWNNLTFQHPVIAPIIEWSKLPNVDFQQPGLEPAAALYWDLDKHADDEAFPVVSYAADEKGVQPPALLERSFDRKKVRGRVLLFTTPLDDTHIAPERRGERRWNTYLQTSFFQVLVNKTIGYLAGDADDATLNYQSGQAVPVFLQPTQRFPTYTIQGPGLSPAEANLTRGEDQAELRIDKAVMPGNYTVTGPDGKRIACFTLNIPADECQLAKVPPEQIEAVFGKDSILSIDRKTSLHDEMQNKWAQPVELLPWLMILALLALACENFLSNKFYRREQPEEEEAVAA